ncbi:hypothetical protein PaeBR_01190 [Paenibacillus sp. BR2-3]|uniref:hypothetical protein n=1 Tax=Paenibacillus sp. BR2-3 TaxID=3048494 RepID=UPI0039774653
MKNNLNKNDKSLSKITNLYNKHRSLQTNELKLLKILYEANFEDLKQVGLVGLLIGFIFTISASVFKEIFVVDLLKSNLFYLTVAIVMAVLVFFYHHKYRNSIIKLKTIELIIKERERIEGRRNSIKK